MTLGILKNQTDYDERLEELDSLIDLAPAPDSPNGRRLELLSLLIEKFEEDHFFIAKPSPLEAIKFRMEQQNLSPSDLVPYLGSRSKVSEVLSGKRELSLAMVKALNQGLDIPAEVLLQEHTGAIEIAWEKFPLKEMVKRGWLASTLEDVKSNAQDYLRSFFEPIGGVEKAIALYRVSERSGRPMDKYALVSWTAHVAAVALKNPPRHPFIKEEIDINFMKEIAKLSTSTDGPIRAREALSAKGICLVVEKALPQTYLDGAAIMILANQPIIGLSLRYDRIDNFWFTLMHELAHISLHYDSSSSEQFYDDLDLKISNDPRELEANELASEALIPRDVWNDDPVVVARSKEAVARLANRLEIHPAIVAGRLRKELNSYHVFNDLVGHGQIRHLFFS